MLLLILVVFLVLAAAGAWPAWGHSRNWGYGPSGGVGLLILVVIVLWMMGYLGHR